MDLPYMPYVWLGVILLSLVVEAITAQMVSIWFAGGGIAAFIVSLIWPANVAVQLALFFVVSILILIAVRPFVRRMLNTKKVSTNADRVLGQTAFVTEEINNLTGCGFVNVSGQIWSARSLDDTVIPAGTMVQIQSIQGVKLMVIPVQNAE